MSDINPLRRLGELGQSPWLDNTHRAMLSDGELALDQDLAQAETDLEALPQLGIDLTEVTDHLEQQGVEAFAKSFDNLPATIRQQAGAVG